MLVPRWWPVTLNASLRQCFVTCDKQATHTSTYPPHRRCRCRRRRRRHRHCPRHPSHLNSSVFMQ